ncbi:cytochrome ubiquinol oxidase subunit I [Aquabacter sp. L1I39]|uniref:cytochrome ubiquinol oxidase subunit I n=1 Tax=Aquabacter sp. L1I39 TaxID=2820278 RepID=UPI001ADD310C|nr:cytochrome ubiquinol oxidase subunit I [Aquabacter sp. L1I39]QTL02660.1 cytochrome ubiquinol oxidase subunit I [Aquabacter sp. L1I39]
MSPALDPVLLARFQFAFTVSFHFIFPAFTIGLASYLAVLNGLWLATGRQVFLSVYQYWLKIFALSFAMGVVSGIVMSYQIGTNWSVYADRTGPVLGPLMAYEVLSAFFLEAGFLGVMLFGLNRVGKGLHFFATVMVMLGTLGSAFWILSVNSWMQTPTGYDIAANGQFVPRDWWNIVFNPSFPYRLVHTVLAAYLTTAFVVGAVGAFHLLRDRSNAGARVMFSMALWMAAVVSPLQIFAGDAHGLNTLEHQPMKLAAIEGHFETNRDTGMPLTLFGLPDMEEGRMRAAIEIPNAGSLILTHSLNGEVAGLDQYPKADWPNVGIVFFSFRIMVGLGFAMLGIGLWSLVRRLRGSIYEARWLQRASVVMGPSGFVAVICGWVTTEVGRQPYTVYGLLRTSESHSPVAAEAIAVSLLAFIVVYFVVFGAGTFYILRAMARAPNAGEAGPDPAEPIRTTGFTPAPQLQSDAGARPDTR